MGWGRGRNIHTKRKKNPKSLEYLFTMLSDLQALSVIEKSGKNEHKSSKERLYDH